MAGTGGLCGVHAELLDGIRALYANSGAMVRTDGVNTEWFDVTSGVRRGCVLSPLSFIMYMNRVTREHNVSQTELNGLLLAEDQSLVHKEEGNIRLNNLWSMKTLLKETEKGSWGILYEARSRGPSSSDS